MFWFLYTLFCLGTGLFIGSVLDEDSIKNEVRNQFPKALYLLIQEKKKKAVNVGIFGDNNYKIQNSIEISSNQGVSDSLYVGQKIYL